MSDPDTNLWRAASRAATTLQLSPPVAVRRAPLSIVALTHGDLVIEFLYAPPEWHVELLLTYQPDPTIRIGLPELVRDATIRDWMDSHRPTSPITIDAEIEWFTKLLLEPCADVLRQPAKFFARFTSQ